ASHCFLCFYFLPPCFLATPLRGAVVPPCQSSVPRHIKLHERSIYGTLPDRMYSQARGVRMQGLN
ncbi:voltage-dependent calcium channel type A subunit alpha-1, partial [Nephila pilipes]